MKCYEIYTFFQHPDPSQNPRNPRNLPFRLTLTARQTDNYSANNFFADRRRLTAESQFHLDTKTHPC